MCKTINTIKMLSQFEGKNKFTGSLETEICTYNKRITKKQNIKISEEYEKFFRRINTILSE